MVVQFGSAGAATLSSKPVRALFFNVESSLLVTSCTNPYSIGNKITLKRTCIFICKFLFVVCNVRKSYLQRNTPNTTLWSFCCLQRKEELT